MACRLICSTRATAPTAKPRATNSDEAARVTPYAAGWRGLAEAEYERARGEARPDAWSRAAAAWDQLDRPSLAAYCRWRHAEALVSAGASRTDASDTLRAAYSVATRLGARPCCGSSNCLRNARGSTWSPRTRSRAERNRAWRSCSDDAARGAGPSRLHQPRGARRTRGQRPERRRARLAHPP